MIDIALWQPEIPGNTGNIIRLCANTGAQLHLIRPLGFTMEDRLLRRAGLDYHEFADVQLHDSLDALLAARRPARCLALSARGTHSHCDWQYRSDDLLLFGPETRGLPDALLHQADGRLRIPMRGGVRSLNLSNAVAVVVYEAWRQLGFPGALL